MHISQIDGNVSSMAGTVSINNIKPEHLYSYNAIKKIAEEKGIDIFISTNKKTKKLPYETIFNVIAKKNVPVITREFYNISNIPKSASRRAVISKRASLEEVSVRIYNAVIEAIENLEKTLLS